MTRNLLYHFSVTRSVDDSGHWRFIVLLFVCDLSEMCFHLEYANEYINPYLSEVKIRICFYIDIFHKNI